MERSGPEPLSARPAGPAGTAWEEHLLMLRNASALGLLQTHASVCGTCVHRANLDVCVNFPQ